MFFLLCSSVESASLFAFTHEYSMSSPSVCIWSGGIHSLQDQILDLLKSLGSSQED